MRPDPTFFRFSRFFRTARLRAPDSDDAFAIALGVVRARRSGAATAAPRCERSERSEKRSAPTLATVSPTTAPDSFLRWRLANAERLTADDLARGYDAGGYCAEHGRLLSYPEQMRGACSWCVSVDRDREPAYWASHWRKLGERP